MEFQYEVNLNNLLIAAPYGGSIAVTRDPKKFVKVQGANKPIISLYSSSGKVTSKFTVRIFFFFFYGQKCKVIMTFNLAVT